MPRKSMYLIAVLIVLSLLLAPSSPAQAGAAPQAAPPDCPPIDPQRMQNPKFLETLPPECVREYKSLFQPEVEEKLPPITIAWSDSDTFGYIYDDTGAFNWISANIPSGLLGDDAASEPVDIGFDFPFYGIKHSQLYFSTNGLITFDGPDTSYPYNVELDDLPPNNLIAAYWTDLIVGPTSLYPSYNGSIYYARGGVAPNRYFVLEWRDVGFFEDEKIISFEAILYENGNISLQFADNVPVNNISYQSLRIGTESIFGEIWLHYISYGDYARNVYFTYPTTPKVRVALGPPRSAQLSHAGSSVDFPLTLYNTGTNGTDTFDFTVSSNWPLTLLQDAPGNLPLTDTDTDGKADTGPLAPGAAFKFIARLSTPGDVSTGSGDTVTLSAASSLTPGVQRSTTLRASVPAVFANVFGDAEDESMTFLLQGPGGSSLSEPGPDGTHGFYPAVTDLPSGNYFYAWDQGPIYPLWANSIQYTIVGHDGEALLPVTQLPNNPTEQYAFYDQLPAVAAAPDGTLALAWVRRIRDRFTDRSNYNIYLATFNSAGVRLSGPTNVTNDTAWGSPWRFSYPTIAATDNNRFVLAWEDEIGYDRLFYALYTTSGAKVLGPTLLPLTTLEGGYPVLNSLTGGKVILTWYGGNVNPPYYAVINQSGTIVKSPTQLATYQAFFYTDAVQLPNGKVAVAWATREGVEYAVLNSSYVQVAGPTNSISDEYQSFVNPISITTDDASHVIVSWANYKRLDKTLMYALADDTGTFLTQPISYRTSPAYIRASINGQGLARHSGTFAPPGAINKSSPANSATKVSTDPVIFWGGTVLAAYYQYCYDNIDDGVCNTSWSAPTIQTSAQLHNLKHQTTYYWQVRAVNMGGITYANGSEGAAWSFTTTNLLTPGWAGSVSVTSDRSLVAVARPHVGAEVASYDGASSGSLTAYVPMLFKNAFGGSYNSAFYVQNVDASHTANITIKFYDSAGSLTCSVDGTVAPLASKGWWVPGQSCLPAGWVGGAVVTSDYSIVTVGRPHVGAEVMTYNGFGSGSTTSYLPMLFKNAFGGSYDSAFYVQNIDESDTANIAIKFYDSAGALTCLLDDTVAPLASKGWWVPSQSCLPIGWVGGAVVTSDQPIVTIGRPHVGNQVTSYSGLPGGSLSMYVPMLFKNAFGGSYDSAFYVQNVDGIYTANLTIKYYNSAGALVCEQTDTVAPLASKGWWVPSQACLPVGWVGGAVVTSDTNIVAVGRPHVGAQVTTYPGIPAGSMNLYLPMLFKQAFGGSYDSAFYLQNTDTINSASVTLKFFDTAGNLSCTRSDTIPALATLGYWVPSVTCNP